MYSQNSEEEVIVKYFGQDRKIFLDIGAYDGKKFSNIMRLCELGWSGACIEPSPIVFTKLMENMKPFPDVKLVNSAIAIESKIIQFFDSNGDAVSTSHIAHKEKWENGSNVRFSPFYIKTITLKEIFDEFGRNFSFINLDVEGQNLDLFNELCNHISYLPNLSLLCIEHDNNYEVMEKRLAKFGFKKLLHNAENIVMGKY